MENELSGEAEANDIATVIASAIPSASQYGYCHTASPESFLQNCRIMLKSASQGLEKKLEESVD